MCTFATFSLLFLSVVVMAKARSLEECPMAMLCTGEDAPVCGLGNRTYGNRCHLLQENCNVDIFAYTEACRSEARCDVAILCATNYSPVCGSNGVTYRNSCVMQQINCREVTVAHEREC
ncbi:hypothetical protein BsWGS_13162 [Bradybaena similaris]